MLPKNLIIASSLTLIAPLSYGSEDAPSQLETTFKVKLKERRKISILGQTSYTVLGLGKNTFAGQSLRGSITYYPYRYLAVDAGYLTMPSKTGELLMSGFDGSLKWFVFSPGAEIEVETSRMKIRSYSHWTHYARLGYKMRTLNFDESQISYGGFSYGYGVNWFIGKEFSLPLVDTMLINGELSTESMSAPSESENLNVINYTLGAGIVY